MIKLSPENVMRFVLLRARMKSLVEREKSEGDKLKESMKYHQVAQLAPVESPFKLILRKCMRSQVDYEDMAKKMYRKHYGREWSIQFEEDREAYGKKPVLSLEVEPNENFKQMVNEANRRKAA